MSGEREEKLKSLGYDLAKISTPKAKYVLSKRAGNLLFSSGALPVDGENLCHPGKVPSEVPLETARQMAALCAANILRAVAKDYGLDRIKQAVKLTGFVNSDSDFPNQHLVVNGASELLVDVLGEAGVHARSALGVAMVPLNACVEVEIVFELDTAAAA
ncbi:MAG: RidA family protein [Alphaproteobacteria bacterium]|nr:RidA family protein [Alphaproteobacteria bacterium]